MARWSHNCSWACGHLIGQIVRWPVDGHVIGDSVSRPLAGQSPGTRKFDR